jgi:hypothetical protein
MSREGRVGLTVIAVAALVLGVATTGAAAAGFGTLSYRVHGPVDARVDGETTVTASCRPGSHVLSGGQYVQAGFRDAIVHSSTPFDGPDADTFPDDGWRSRIDSFNGAQNAVTEYAICSTRQPRYRKDGYDLGEGTYYPPVQIKCPTRDSAFGGGIDISPGYDTAAVLDSAPTPPAPTGSWKGLALVMENRPPHQRITGWIICGKAELTERSATGEVTQNSFGMASAACPATTSLVGGGMRTPPFDKFDLPDVRPTTFGPVDGPDSDLVPDNRWRMKADDWGGGGGLHVEATAICLQ